MSKTVAAKTLEALAESVVLSTVVGKTVALSEPRAGKRKGLCPFHDEKTPSFTIDDSKNLYYCFGCGQHGDAIDFIKNTEHTSFSAAVRILAEIFNVPFELNDGTIEDEVSYSHRQRLVQANKAAALFFTDRLVDADAELARDFIVERGFDIQSAVITFGVGFSPRGWDDLTKHLSSKGFTEDEIVEAGLATRGEKGVFDRFRGRLMFPILNERGEHVAFGGRQLFQEENSAKYVNTTDTPIYKKASTLFGLHAALKSIHKNHEVIVVEGYTDVMALRASGIHNVIASSGTAFGPDHLRALRRVMAPQGVWLGRVVFAFDGDSAGREAATRAFHNTVQDMSGQVFAVSSPDGLDPCDVRLAYGDEVVRERFSDSIPLVQFVLDGALADADVATIQGRFDAAGVARALISKVPDALLVGEYSRYVAALLGISVKELAVTSSKAKGPEGLNSVVSIADEVELEALRVLVQSPNPDWLTRIEVDSFVNPLHRGAAGVILAGEDGSIQGILSRCQTDAGKAFISRLAIEPLGFAEGNNVTVYTNSVLSRLLVQDADRHIAGFKLRLAEGDDVESLLISLSSYRRELLADV